MTTREVVREIKDCLDEHVLAPMRNAARREYGTHQHHAKRVLDAAADARAALGRLESEIELRDAVIAESQSRAIPFETAS